jgi:hypothetical protein
VEGTLAKHILTEPEYIQSMHGAKIPLHMSVTYISFSAHADYTETAEFVDALKPPYVILVHGDASEGCGRLRYALESKYSDGSIRIIAPRNLQTVELQFRAQKVAKTVGSLAANPPGDGTRMSGLLVRKNFVDYTLMAEEELPVFTALASTTVEQQIKVPFHQTFACMRYFIGQMYELDEDDDEEEQERMQGEKMDTEEKNDASSSAASKQPTVKSEFPIKQEPGTSAAASSSSASKKKVDEAAQTITVHGSVSLSYRTQPSTHIVVRWSSNPVNDMLSDSLIAILTNIESNPGMAKVIGSQGECRHGGVGGHANADGTQKTAAAAAVEKPTPMSDVASSGASSPEMSNPSSSTHAPSFRWFLEQHYGSDLAFDSARETYSFTLNTIPCVVHLRTLEVDCADAELRKRISMMVRRAHAACQPITKKNTTAIVEEIEENQPVARKATA